MDASSDHPPSRRGLPNGVKYLLAVFFCLAVIAVLAWSWETEAWFQAQARWKARGETLDYARFIPPPVPDNQNLAAIPLFEIGPDTSGTSPSWSKQEYLPNLNHALVNLDRMTLPPTSGPAWDDPPNQAKINAGIAEGYAKIFPRKTPPANPLAQFDELFPFTAGLRAAAATRPLFRLKQDYNIQPPLMRLLGPMVKQIALSKVLAFDAVLALSAGQSEVAFGDIRVNYIILNGVKRDPTLVGGLVAIGISAITRSAIAGGLSGHEWNDRQLAQLEDLLAPMNYLADFQFALRAESAADLENLIYYKHRHLNIGDFLGGPGPAGAELLAFGPFGWWDDNARKIVDLHLAQVATVDPDKRLVFPDKADELGAHVVQEGESWTAETPWNIWYTMAAGGTVNALSSFAQAQVWNDETLLACALERYRLAHGSYPTTLDALVPACISALPHDIMNGKPYCYRLNPDGTFTLYSVGWNQTDDGGVTVPKSEYKNSRDPMQGDWVWPMPRK